MSKVTVTSTTDSKADVMAATGNLSQKQTDEKPVESPKVEKVAKEKPLKAEKSEVEEKELSAKEIDDEIEDEDGQETQDETSDERPKKKGGFKRRIDKLTAQKAEAEREKEFWRQEALKSRQPEPAKVEKTDKVDAAEPKAEDFATHAEFVRAQARYEVKKELADQAKANKDAELKANHAKRQSTLAEKILEFKKSHTDFDDAMADVDDIPMSVTVHEAILSADDGPGLMYALANDRAEYERICKLPYDQAVRAIGRFEARLEKPSESVKETKTNETKTTKAPKPVSPVGSKAGAGQKDPGEMNYQEFKKWRAESASRS